MRVTSNSYSESLLTHLQTLTRRQTTLQTQIASGQRIQQASDDPLAAQQVLGLRDDSVATAQYAKNIQTHQEFAATTHSTLQSLQKILNRAQEIAFTVDELDPKEALQSYGVEIGELIKNAVQLANRQHRGEYIFAGTKSDAAPFASTLDDQGRVTAVEFRGNTTLPESEVSPDDLVTSSIAGANATGTGELGLFIDTRSGADIFAHLVTLRDQLLAGDAKAIQDQARADLKKDEENFLYHVAANGALQSRLESMLDLNNDQKLALETDISRRTDIDYSEAIVRLSQQQTAYEATLQSASSILNMSLLSFLR